MQFLKGLTRFFHFDSKPPADKDAITMPQLSRRGLLMGLGASLVVAAMPEIPFGRVWSIPKKIVYPPGALTPEMLRRSMEQIRLGMGNVEPTWIMHPVEYSRLKELVADGTLGRGPATVSEMIGGLPVVVDPYAPMDRIYKMRVPLYSEAIPIQQPLGLIDRYGNALTGKLERTIVEPVRSELEDVLDLVS